MSSRGEAAERATFPAILRYQDGSRSERFARRLQCADLSACLFDTDGLAA